MYNTGTPLTSSHRYHPVPSVQPAGDIVPSPLLTRVGFFWVTSINFLSYTA